MLVLYWLPLCPLYLAKKPLEGSVTQIDAANPPPAAISHSASDEEICYFLNRISFGVRPGDIEAVKAMGIGNFLNQQLNPQSIGESNMVNDFIGSDEDLTMSPVELFIRYGPPAVKAAMQAAVSNNNPQDKKEAQKAVRAKRMRFFKTMHNCALCVLYIVQNNCKK